MLFVIVAMIVIGLAMLTYGGFLLVLTSGGDLGGDSGIHESGCVISLGGGALLLVAVAILGLEGA